MNFRDKLNLLTNKVADKIHDMKLKEDFNLYHASGKQGLKQLKPELSKTRAKKNVKGVYATDDKSYASGFCFNWSEDEGFEFGRYGDEAWVLEVPKKYKDKLDKPCSIYIVNGDFNKVNISTPEYISDKVVRISSEEKYDTARECMEKNGVEIKIV